jgi:anti-anti-sigma factor
LERFSVHVHILRKSGVALVRPEGRFFGGSETRELESKLGALLTEGHPIVVIDLERTLHLNSTAIGVLVGAHVRASRRGAEVRLCNIDHGIRHTLVILKLVNEMVVFDSLREAIAAPLASAAPGPWVSDEPDAPNGTAPGRH